MNAASEGDKALANSDLPAAIRHFTTALKENPRAPTYYIKRATAYTRLKPADGGPDYHSALRDAEIAVLLARERGRLELILDAQMRRAVALYHLERYGDAGFLLDFIDSKIDRTEKKAEPGIPKPKQSSHKRDQELSIWRIKLKGKVDRLDPNDEKLKVTVKDFPEGIDTSEDALKRALTSPADAKADDASTAEKTKESQLDVKGPGASAPMAAGPAAPQAPSKIRHEWYQSNDRVVITVYAKGVKKEELDIDLKETSVSQTWSQTREDDFDCCVQISVQFPLPSSTTYSFNLDPLFAPIVPSESSVSPTPSKVEISLRKQTPGQKWNSLEDSEAKTQPSATTTTTTTTESTTSSTTPTTAPTSTAPAYPTSSRHGAKDWDKVAADLTAKSKSKKPKEKRPKEKKDDDEEDTSSDMGESDAESIDSEYGGDPVDAFFKKLYAKSDPDTRRAMVKSFYESQGTALSTNWEEVSKGKVPVRE